MTTAPTAGQVQNALAGRGQAISTAIRVEHRTKGGLFLADLTAAWIAGEGGIECDNSRAVITTGDMLFFADLMPALDELDQLYVYERVKVRPRGYTDAVEVDVPIGLFRPSFSERRRQDDGRPLLAIHLQDQTSHLISATLDEPYEVAAGTAYRTEMGAILTSLGLRNGITAGGPVTPLAHTFGPGETWYAVLKWLADGINYFTPYPDREGIFRTKERINPANVEAAIHYADTDAGVQMLDIEAGYREPLDRVAVKNRCVVVIDDPRHADYGYTTWENADPTSPVSTENVATDLVAFDYDTSPSTRCILDAATAEAIARYELRAQATLASQSELSTFPDPRREPHEYYTVTLLDAESAQKFRVLGWRRSFGSQSMQHRLARVTSVALTEVTA